MSYEETIDDGTWTNCDEDILKEEAEYRSLIKTESSEETHRYRSLNTVELSEEEVKYRSLIKTESSEEAHRYRSLNTVELSEGEPRNYGIYIDTEIKEGEHKFDRLHMNVQCENIQVGSNNILNRNESVFHGSEIDMLAKQIEEMSQILNSKENVWADSAINREILSNLMDRMDMFDSSLVEIKQILLQKKSPVDDYVEVDVKRKNKRDKLKNGFKRLKQLFSRRRIKTKAVDVVVELDDEPIYDRITLFAAHFEHEDPQPSYERTSDGQLLFRGASSQELQSTYTGERRYSALSYSDDMSYGSYDSLIDCTNQNFFLPKPQ